MDCNISQLSIRKIARGNIRARVSIFQNATTRLKSKSTITNNNGTILGSKSKLKCISNFRSKFIHTLNLIGLKSEHNSDINATLLLSGVFHARLQSNSKLSIPYTEKLGGSFGVDNYINFKCVEKLYPVQDIVSTSGTNYFVNQDLQSSDLYNSVDEGIFVKEYDEKTTYIQPWSIYTSGNFKYKFKVNDPYIRPKESLLLLRASAPFYNYSSKTAPLYTISNIRFEDPSGNLIIKYKDFTIRGDADYDKNYVNFATYIIEPEINNVNLYNWENNYPLLGSGISSGNYTVNLDISIQSLDDPFDDGYNEGYQDFPSFQTLLNSGNNYLALDGAPLSTQNEFINPANSLRITAIELCNSGELATFREQYLKFYTNVSETGLRITRNIFPNQILTSNSYNEIYPSSDSTWAYETSNNITTSGANTLVPLVRDVNNNTNIQLIYSSIEDSGKLQLKFSHEPPVPFDGYSDGAFSFGSLRQTKSLDSAIWKNIADTDSFFIIDKVDLVVVAKKASGSRDYSLDVVGYSDDKLLHVTSKVGGFLQNLENSGVSTIPTTSGFYGIDDFGISSETLSNKYQYYENNLTNNDGGDHYLLSTYPVISETSFQEYTIPLKIYDDRVSIGKSTDYSMSSYFENLYLDIYPIPSGASISSIKLVISYKPSNGLMLHTIGQANKELAKQQLRLLPNSDIISSSGSLVKNIPHSYTRDTSLKTNYSTRWKGVKGSIFAGPYNKNEFDFSFYNPQLYDPFINGYFSFNHDSGNVIISDYSFENTRLSSVVTGVYVGNYNKVTNLGLRFNSTQLFDNSTDYTTIDWTSEGHELCGKISDNFENAVRVSGDLGYLNFGPIVTSGGFFVSARFSPDINMSGVGYNLWNSGIIFNKDELRVYYSGGLLTACCINDNLDEIFIQDNKQYYEYSYPLTISLSYKNNKLNLIANENIVDTSDSFIIQNTNSDLIFGIGVNGFLTNVGISTIIGPSGYDTENIDLLSNLFTDLHSTVNNNNANWKLGDFKICSFNQAYDRFTERYGSGILLHYLKHSGSGYSQSTNLALPSSIYIDEVAYHTQIENDFVRFGLQDTNEVNPNFYSAYPRINKNLPRGYKFEEQAFAIDTILEHNIYNEVYWLDGNVGPKLIVSLYTPNKEPVSYPTTNYGLINRQIHYLEPSGCWRKITSKFDFNNLIDNIEPWSEFNKDQYLTEFNHKYFSKDIDDMFVQYDIVYPSGRSFESFIKIHSINVRIENALVTSSGTDNFINFVTSGEAIRQTNLNLSLPKIYESGFDFINLYTSGTPIETESGILNLHCSGATLSNGYMPLHTITIGNISNLGNEFFGSIDPNFGFNLYTSGQLFVEENMPLVVANIVPEKTTAEIPLITFNNFVKNNSIGYLNFILNAARAPRNNIPASTCNLYILGSTPTSEINTNFNLYLESFKLQQSNSLMNLFIVNAPRINVELGKETISWNNKNIGVNITVNDNIYASLAANDEIRGVELICYGDCR